MKRTIYLLLFVCYLFVTGCTFNSNTPPDLPKLVPCFVTVIQDGEPLADAMVGMKQQDVSGSVWMIGGTTDANGIAKMMTYGQYPGTPEGRFKVSVTKQEVITEESAATPSGMMTPPPKQTIYSLVLPKYGDYADSSLELNVKAGTQNYSVDVGKAIHELVVQP